MQSDFELLARYVAGEQGAFAELTKRHAGAVYGAARRMLGGPGREAEDVTQAVFLLLAQKAGGRWGLVRGAGGRGSLAGWLYKATRYCCSNVRKAEGRRKKHEREAAMVREQATATAEDLRPVLDEGLAKLGEKERQAVLVRYLEGRTGAEVAEMLGISAEATEKRLERGIGKLRVFFAGKGFPVAAGTVAAVLAAEGAQGAPVALVMQIGAGNVAGVQVAAMAKGAATMMSAAKAAGVATACAGIALVIGAGAAIAAAAGRGSEATAALKPLTEGQIDTVTSVIQPRVDLSGGRVMFMRWDVMTSEAGLNRVKGVLTPVATASKGYEVSTGDAEKVRQAVLEAMKNKEVWMVGNRVGWSAINQGFGRGDRYETGLWAYQPFNIFTQAGDEAQGRHHVYASLEPMGPQEMLTEVRGDAVRVTMAATRDLKNVLHTDEGPMEFPGLRLAYTGDIPVGQALVTTTNLGDKYGMTFRDIGVWQAFRCTPEEWEYLERNSAGHVLEAGVAGLRTEISRTTAWNQQAKAAEPVMPKWEQKLENGAVVRVLGVQRAGRWPDCWWSAEGEPVKGSAQWRWGDGWPSDPTQLMVVVRAEDPSVPDVARTGDEQQPRKIEQVSVVRADGRVEVGIGAGPWINAGRIAVGETRTVKGVQVKLMHVKAEIRKRDGMQGMSYIESEQTEVPEVEVRVAGIDRQGKVMNSPRNWEVLFDQKNATHARMGQYNDSVQFDVEDIDHVEIFWRRRSWTMFGEVVRVPRVLPEIVQPVAVKEQAVPPAQTAAGGQAAVGAGATLPAGADMTTPEGFMKAFVETLKTGDPQKARGMMAASSDLEKRMADAQAGFMTYGEVLRAAAREKFGASAVGDALVQTGILPEVKAELGSDFEWKVEGDKARLESRRPNIVMTSGPGGTLVRVAGKWQMEMALPKEVLEQYGKQVEGQLLVMEKMGALRKDLAAEVRAGKYAEVSVLRNAFQERQQAIQKASGL